MVLKPNSWSLTLAPTNKMLFQHFHHVIGMDCGYDIILNVYKLTPHPTTTTTMYVGLWLAGTTPEHCQSQNVNKTLIGCWPVRIGLSEKKGNNWPCGFKASRVRWWKGIRRAGFKAPQRRTPIGPGAIWVKRESKGILQRGGKLYVGYFK